MPLIQVTRDFTIACEDVGTPRQHPRTKLQQAKVHTGEGVAQTIHLVVVVFLADAAGGT